MFHNHIIGHFQDFNRVYINHYGSDAVYLEAINIYWTDGTCRQCRRKDNNNRVINWIDDRETIDLSCNTGC